MGRIEMKLPKIDNKLELLSDEELYEKVSKIHLRLRQLKIEIKENQEIAELQLKLDEKKSIYRVKGLRLKTYLEKIVNELRLRKLDIEFEEIEL